MYEDERLKKIEQLLIKHDGILQNLSGKDEAQKRFMRDLMTNLDEDNVPSLKYKITSGDMTAAINAYANDAEAAIDLKLTGYNTKTEITQYINGIDSSIALAAQYAGTYTEVASAGLMTDKTKIYKYSGKYYRWYNGAWVETVQPPVAASLAAIQMQANQNGAAIQLLAEYDGELEDAIASINTKANANEASVALLAQYTGQSGSITVATWSTSGKDTSKTYYATNTGLFYKYNGTEWVGSASTSEAAFILSAINGQSTIKMKADNIDFTGVSTFLTADDLGEDGTTIIHGSRLDTDTVATNALKVRTESNLDWLDFYAGIDMTVIDMEDESYYPDTRQLKGVKNIRLYKDTGLTSGHGDIGNTLQEIGSLQVNTTGISTLEETWNSGVSLFMVDTDYPTALELSSGSGIAISSGKAAYQSGPIVLTAYNDSIKTSGYSIRVTKTAIQFWKYVSGSPVLLEQWA